MWRKRTGITEVRGLHHAPVVADAAHSFAMHVRDMMTRQVISVTPDDTIERARTLFRANNIHHLLVVEDDTVVGLVTVREVAGKTTGLVRDVMLRNIPSIDADATLKKAASLMLGRSTGCLPVLDAGKLAGIITTTDLMRVINSEATLPLR